MDRRGPSRRCSLVPCEVRRELRGAPWLSHGVPPEKAGRGLPLDPRPRDPAVRARWKLHRLRGVLHRHHREQGGRAASGPPDRGRPDARRGQHAGGSRPGHPRGELQGAGVGVRSHLEGARASGRPALRRLLARCPSRARPLRSRQPGVRLHPRARVARPGVAEARTGVDQGRGRGPELPAIGSGSRRRPARSRGVPGGAGRPGPRRDRVLLRRVQEPRPRPDEHPGRPRRPDWPVPGPEGGRGGLAGLRGSQVGDSRVGPRRDHHHRRLRQHRGVQHCGPAHVRVRRRPGHRKGARRADRAGEAEGAAPPVDRRSLARSGERRAGKAPRDACPARRR